MATDVDMGGNDLHVNSLYTGATGPGVAGTNISGAEIAVLDAVTPGTAAASKAVVLNASKGISTITSATITTLTATDVNTTTVTPTTIAGAANFTGTPTFGALSASGGITTKSATAVPATAGAVAAGAPITCFSSGWKLWVTSDVPTHTATKGDLCINTGGSSTSTRLYVNNGTTTWIAITTAS